MATVKANNTVSLNFTQDLAYGLGQTTTLPVPFILRSVLNISGSLADQCTKLYCPTGGIALVASTPQTLDLTSLVDIHGAALSFSAVRVLAIRNKAATDGWVLLVGAAASNAWEALVSAAGTLTVYPSSAVNDGFALFQIPNTTGGVVDSTHKSLKLDPGAHSFTVDILIAGY